MKLQFGFSYLLVLLIAIIVAPLLLLVLTKFNFITYMVKTPSPNQNNMIVNEKLDNTNTASSNFEVKEENTAEKSNEKLKKVYGGIEDPELLKLRYEITVLPDWEVERATTPFADRLTLRYALDKMYSLTINQGDISSHECIYGSNTNSSSNYKRYYSEKDITDSDKNLYKRSNIEKNQTGTISNSTYDVCQFKPSKNYYELVTYFGNIYYTVSTSMENPYIDQTLINEDILNQMDKMISTIKAIN